MISNNNSPFIETDIPDSLNFALFIRYRFIEPFAIYQKNIFIKEYSHLFQQSNLKNRGKINISWDKWWNDLLKKRMQINLEWEKRYGIDPADNFLSINKFPELQELCINNWEVFSKWWYDRQEGRFALRSLEKQYDFYSVFISLENNKEQSIKPFSQYIDYVFGYVPEILDINNHYTLVNITNDISKEYFESLILSKIRTITN